MPLMLVMAVLAGKQREVWNGAFSRWAVIRTVLMVVMLIAMYAALPFLSLAVVAAGIYTAPIFVTLMSSFLIKEPVSARGWLAIAIGFAGVLIILQPGTEAFSFWVLLPVVGGFLYALANIVTRSKCHSLSKSALALSLQTGFLLAGVAVSLVLYAWPASPGAVDIAPFITGSWNAVGNFEWLLVASLSVVAILISMALAGAYQVGVPSTVATFDYSYLVFVVIWDYLVFSIAPTITTTVGIAMIVLAGLLVLRSGRPN